jgi:hypothetical protein
MTDYLAQNQSEGTFTPEELLAGGRVYQTEGGKTVVSGQNLARFTIVAYDANGKLTAWDDTAVADADASEDTVNLPTTVAKPVGVMLHACDASGGDKTGQAIAFDGCFSDQALVWPASLSAASTLLRQAALAKFGANFTVARLG